MLKSFLELQQKALDALGEERSRLRERLQQETRRSQQLTLISETLQQEACPPHPLYWQNKQGMQQQVKRLLAHQQQQQALVESELNRQESQLRQQFGKVKGLESVLSAQAAARQHRAQQAEQKQADELATQAFLRR